MSLRTPTPTRLAAPPRPLTRVLESLAGDGWRLEIVSAEPAGPRRQNPRLSCSIIARRATQTRPEVVVLHGHFEIPELRIEDVWRVVAHVNEVQGTDAVLCIPAGLPVSRIARETATRLSVEIRPLVI